MPSPVKTFVLFTMQLTTIIYLLPLLLLFIQPATTFRIGIGIHDITGPAADVNMMGYAKISQNTRGIHTRLYSRVFLIEEDTHPDHVVLFINLDIGMTSQLVKTKSVHMAIQKQRDGRILVSHGQLTDASINRSPAAYLLNPVKERERYTHDRDTEMTVLKFIDSSTGQPMGMLNWFAVHATSMNNTNRLITGDNKGMASIMFEQRMNGVHQQLGQGPFIAAFAQANEGDVSPNIAGPRCLDTGEPCDFIQSTCGGKKVNDVMQANHSPIVNKNEGVRIVLAGLSNVYTSYIATPEEYEMQRYEGASTIYGPYTLPAYVRQFERLAEALVLNKPLPKGPTLPYFEEKLFSFLPPVLFDTARLGYDFGDCTRQPLPKYERLDDEVIVQFISANPRNDMRLNGTYLAVEILDQGTSEWNTLFTDSNLETRFYWDRPYMGDWLLGQSEATITWQVRAWDGSCQPGQYRIQHFGTSKHPIHRTLHSFTGTTNQFQVTCGV